METFYLPIEKIVPEENKFEDLDGELFEKLVDSIEKYGILEPLLVSKENGNYKLIQGHQRLRAAKKLGFPEVPCQHIEDEETALGAKYDVNLYRRHLNLEEIIAYEEKKEIEKEEFKSKYSLIPELEHLENIIPEEFKKALLKLPKEQQRKFYNALPVKYVNEAYEIEEQTKQNKEKIQDVTKQIKEKDQEIFELMMKLEKMEEEIERLNEIKNAKKEEINKMVKIKLEQEKQKLEKQLKTEYSDNEFSIKLDEYKKKLEKEYKEKLEKELAKEVEEYRKIAEKHSKEREELKRQFTPLQEEIKRLKKDLELFKQSEENAKKAEEYTKTSLMKFLEQAKTLDTFKILINEMVNLRKKISAYQDIIVNMGSLISLDIETVNKIKKTMIPVFEKELNLLIETSRVTMNIILGLS